MTLAVDFNTEIKYSRANRDFDMLIDGQYVGSRSTYHEAEVALNEIVLDKLTHGDHLSASQLDGGSPEAVNWSDRPDYADPPGDEPAPETGLGSSGDEGDDPDAHEQAGCYQRFWGGRKSYQRLIGRTNLQGVNPHRRRARRTRKTQLAYLLMCYRVDRCTPPAFLRADFAARKDL